MSTAQHNTCELCCSPKPCIPNRGRLVCSDCSWAEMQDHLKHEGLRIIEDGRETTYRTHDENGMPFCHPRAWSRRS